MNSRGNSGGETEERERHEVREKVACGKCAEWKERFKALQQEHQRAVRSLNEVNHETAAAMNSAKAERKEREKAALQLHDAQREMRELRWAYITLATGEPPE